LALARAHTDLYRKQQTTPIEEQVCHSEEQITVIDPRHPLYERTFPLIEIAPKQYLGLCCVVAYRPPLMRYIPLVATDRSPEPLVIYPLPLNLDSVQQLLATYKKIVSQPAEGTEDEFSQRDSPQGAKPDRAGAVVPAIVSKSDRSSGDLVSDEPRPTSPTFTEHGMLGTPTDPPSGHNSGGGEA
jgi:hypothetical protein